jgi:hypothetical protein
VGALRALDLLAVNRTINEFDVYLGTSSGSFEIAKHGFRSVTHKLAGDYEQLKKVCARHGVEISATRVRSVLRHFTPEPQRGSAWGRIFGQTTGALLRQAGIGA